MAVAQADTEVMHNPSSLLNIFTNSLTNDATKKIFRIKGKYVVGNGINYRGLYYDNLKEESSDSCITLIVSAIFRSQLMPEQIIECTAYLTKKVQLNGGRIDLEVNMDDYFHKSNHPFQMIS